MKEIDVGIRIDTDFGLSFTGIEAVNGLLNRGGKIVSLQPGGALMRKLGEDGEDVQLTLSGCHLQVIVDDTGVESSPQTLEHNRLFQEGNDLITPYMKLVGRDSAAIDSPQASEELEQGIALLRQALEIDPANWPAHWSIGKAHQALGDSQAACEAFGKSFALQKGVADVAREYMFECLNVGRVANGIAAARHAVQLKPQDAGLVANLALALLIGAQLDEAAETIAKALSLAPQDEISHSLRQLIEDVQSGRKPQPQSMADLS